MRILLLVLSLSGCAALPPVYRPVDMPTPVAVPCHAPVIATPVIPIVPVSADVAAKTRAVLIELDLRKAYETRLQAALTACE